MTVKIQNFNKNICLLTAYIIWVISWQTTDKIMPQTNYNLHLKGFVGGADFDRDFVDFVLAKNAGKDVNVLIGSLGEAGAR